VALLLFFSRSHVTVIAQRVLLASFGGGFAWGATVIEWEPSAAA